jgi:hypothetical protein
MARKAKPAAATGGSSPGKRRTREHVIAALSVNHVERLILKCGFVVQRSDPDYGYDLRLETFDERGNLEAGHVPLQLKATDDIEGYALATEEAFSFPISTKDYRLWSEEPMAVFLILYDAVLEEACWLHAQGDHPTQPRPEGDTIRVHVPRHQVLGVRTIRATRQRKQATLEAIKVARRQNPKPQEG